jgi:hypothetical protein
MAKASLKYSSLKDSEIRLLRFQKDATHISGFELILKSFEAGTAPPYLALSYVWGDPTKPQKIHVSSCKFDATANFFKVLHQIHDVSATLEQGLGHAVDSAS